MDIDLQNEDAWEANTGNLLEVGEYMTVIELLACTRTNSNNPQIELRFNEVNRVGDIRDWLVITPKTVGKLKQLAVAAEAKLERLDPDDDWDGFVEWCKNNLHGKRCGIVVRLEDDRKRQEEGVVDAKRTRVRSYLTKQEFADLKTQMGSDVGSADPMAAAFAGESAPPRTDDDIPF